MPSPYNSGSRPANNITYPPTSVTETKYRNGNSESFYTTTKEVSHRRGGTGTVIIQTKK